MVSHGRPLAKPDSLGAGFGLGLLAAEFANAQHEGGAQVRHGVVQPGVGVHDVLQRDVADDGLTTDPADQGGAQRDDYREAVHQLDHDLAAKNHQRDADGQAQDQQRHAALGGSGHGDHVVQAHHQVGDQDGADGDPQAGLFTAFAFFLFVTAEQLGADPQQQQAADDLQVGQRQQLGSDHGHHDPQHHGGARAEQDGFFLLVFRQRAGGQRDHHRVVTREDDVDPDDFDQADPKIAVLQHVHARSLRCSEKSRSADNLC